MDNSSTKTAGNAGGSSEETIFIEMRLALKELLKRYRQKNSLSQQDLARKLGTGQARVSRIERADPGVSTDQLLKALLAMGATREEIAQVIGESDR